ncbi:MAG TPA: M23 family metallopeptidase [Prolixibacteraceae bacterium]|nr:M23 family metallopeptidase [Prolixibacteraceae bacterium]
MNRRELRKKLFQMLKDHYRLIIYNDSTIQTVWSIKLTPIKVVTLGGLGAIMLILLTSVIIAYTPLRENIPGYPSAKVRQQIIVNYMLVDSLENEIKIRDSYFDKIRTVFQGEVPPDETQENDSEIKTYDVKFKSFNADSAFKEELEAEKQNSLATSPQKKASRISSLHFKSPLHGKIINKFNAKTGHLAVDVAGKLNARIESVLDGTVIFAGWTMDAGNCVYIQHDNNLISVYKHNGEVLKKIGDIVKAGDEIAIMGNTGELTAGPHLHFELWRNGSALDPDNYIDF